MSKAKVAIVGRPNVGKSTLFNRILGHRHAIVEDLPGTTRDRIVADVSVEGRDFTLIDSGGLEPGAQTVISQKVRDQVLAAIEEADLIVFLVDAKDGILPDDHDIADILRRQKKPVVLAANKIDDLRRQEQELAQFYELAVAEPVALSAYHGKGVDDLLSAIADQLPPEGAPEPAGPNIMKIAIVGRPNVGKSMLTNTLLGEERLIVHDVPGTTRDTVDTILHWEGEDILLIDTAGIRRRGKIEAGIERYSLLRTQDALERADIAILLLDAVEGITAQDTHILGLIQKAAKGAILGMNKWDLVEFKDTAEWMKVVRQRTRFMPYAEVLFLSAKTGYGVDEILPAARRIFKERTKIVPEKELDEVLRKALAAHPPGHSGTREIRIKSVRQEGINPPTFEFKVNDAKLVHFSYRRYLENALRKAFGFQGTAIQLQFRSRVKGGGKTKGKREDRS